MRKKIIEQLRLWRNRRFIEHAIWRLESEIKYPFFGYALCVMYSRFFTTKMDMSEYFPEFFKFIFSHSKVKSDIFALGDLTDAKIRLEIIHDFLKQYPQYKPKNYDRQHS